MVDHIISFFIMRSSSVVIHVRTPCGLGCKVSLQTAFALVPASHSKELIKGECKIQTLHLLHLTGLVGEFLLGYYFLLLKTPVKSNSFVLPLGQKAFSSASFWHGVFWGPHLHDWVLVFILHLTQVTSPYLGETHNIWNTWPFGPIFNSHTPSYTPKAAVPSLPWLDFLPFVFLVPDMFLFFSLQTQLCVKIFLSHFIHNFKYL